MLKSDNMEQLSELKMKFDEKISALEKYIFDVPNIESKIVDELEQSCGYKPTEFIVFISISDLIDKARVFKSRHKKLDEAWKDVVRKAYRHIEENKYEAVYIKADFVNSLKRIETSDLPGIVSSFGHPYFFRNGIALDNFFTDSFLESEINGNNLIDYKKTGELKLRRINEYLNEVERTPVLKIPSSIIVFSCRGYIYDDGECYTLHHLQDPNYGRRIVENVDDVYVDKVIYSASKFIADSVLSNGKFIYGYYPIYEKQIMNYNIVRHAGTIWTLIVAYKVTKNEDLLPKISSTIQYLIGEIENEDDETAYVVARISNEIKLGGSAVAIVALINYMEEFGTREYASIVEMLGNGILKLLNIETGTYYHVLHFNESGQENYSKKEEFRTIYYEGEATFALAKLYGFLGDEKWLAGAKSAMENFIRLDYTKYRDHWVSYAANEVSKYIPDERYFEFGLRNVTVNLKKIHKGRTTNHICTELLTIAFEMYDRIIQNNIHVSYLEKFDVKQFIDVIFYRIDYMLNGYFYPEYVMYFKNPDKLLGTFFIRHANYRVRIDDVQHFVGGYYTYRILYDRLKALREGEKVNG